MDKMPKRRKSKDNPYILSKDEKNNIYLVSFVDGTNTYRSIKITKEVYQAMDCFERQDLKEMNEYDRHIEHSEIYENTLEYRIKDKKISLEENVIEELNSEKLRKAIEILPKKQKKRIKMYFIENKTYEEIGKIEGCTKVAAKYSIDIGLQKIKKFLKNL